MPRLPTISEGKRKVIYIIWYNVNVWRGLLFDLSKVETAYPRGGEASASGRAECIPRNLFFIFYFLLSLNITTWFSAPSYYSRTIFVLFSEITHWLSILSYYLYDFSLKVFLRNKYKKEFMQKMVRMVRGLWLSASYLRNIFKNGTRMLRDFALSCAIWGILGRERRGRRGIVACW